LFFLSEFDVFKAGYFLWLNGLWGLVWKFFMIGSGWLGLVLTYLILTSSNKYSKGADDNSSGVLAMLKVAKALRALNLKIGVNFVFFTGEERGLWGSRNWIYKHIKHLDKDKSYFLNIDCVGRGEKFFLTKGMGKIFKKKSDPMLCKIVEDVCNKLNYKLEKCWGAVSDDMKLLESNLRTCSIMRCDVRKVNVIDKILRKCFFIPIKNDLLPFMNWIHSGNDIVKYVDENKLKETTRLVINFIERLDEKTRIRCSY